MREAMAQLTIPQDYSVIIRTPASAARQELQWDLDYLAHLWDAISKAAADRAAPFLIYQESNLVIRAIRDYLRADIGEVLIDNPEIYERAQRFMQQVMPQNIGKLKQYTDETRCSRASRSSTRSNPRSRARCACVRRRAGVDRTEALVTIDATRHKGADIEETALNTNLEAAEKWPVSCGCATSRSIVIDFIDMTPERSNASRRTA